ncbi:unnamed protein product [Camellia sinensis]
MICPWLKSNGPDLYSNQLSPTHCVLPGKASFVFLSMQKARNKGFELEQSFEESFEESCEEGRKLCGSLKKEENSVKKLINDLGEFGKQGSYISASVDQEQGNKEKARNKGFELEQSFEESFEESCEEGRKLCGSLKKEENFVKKLINDLGEFGKQGSYISASVDQEQGNKE